MAYFSRALHYVWSIAVLLHSSTGLEIHRAPRPKAAELAHVFLERTSRHVSEPAAVHGDFMQAIADAPGDVLCLLYSPSCPDCEWLMEKVWKTVASKLAAYPDTTVMTISDPGFDTPKPFEHWHNPAIFWAGKDQKAYPIFFPQARLEEYLGGLPSRPQDQQDADFAEDLLIFAKGALGARIFSEPTVPTGFGKSRAALADVDDLADNGWATLQGKWAAARAAGGSVPAIPGQTVPVASLMSSAQNVQMQAFDANAGQSAQMQAQQMPLQQPSQLAMAYAEQYVQSHIGAGYTVAGVYNYVLPYYQKQMQMR